MRGNIFFVGLILAASSLVSPPLALLGGIVYGFTLAHPFAMESRRLAKFLLQASVVGLGFGMSLHDVLRTGSSGFFYAALSIVATMLLGIGLGGVIHVGKKSAFLISAGTAICGGSAIAAVGPIADASDDEMAVSLGAVFMLNALALFLFPMIGYAAHMTQTQFGLWSALAIQDTSSVVGATSRYGPVALTVGTTVKLARALWIVPLSLATAVAVKSKARIRWPWFILLFCLAALVKNALPAWNSIFDALNHLAKTGLTVTLFLIGAQLNRKTLKYVGCRPLFQALALWVIVSGGTLALILSNWIRL